MHIPTLLYEDFKSSTITIKAKLTTEVNVQAIANFLVVNNRFDEHGKRIKKGSKSRAKIEYYGPEESIVSICYDKLRRGMRTGAMNNMLQMDIQYSGMNIHHKLSANAITIVGVSSIELANGVSKVLTKHITHLKQILNYCSTIDKSERKKMVQFILSTVEKYQSINEDKFPRLKDLIKTLDIPAHLDQKFIKICLSYLDDYDQLKVNKTPHNSPHKFSKAVKTDETTSAKEEIETIKEEISQGAYEEKLDMLCENYSVMKDDTLDCVKFDIYNSVYHIDSPNKNFKISLHQLAIFFHNQGVNVEYHNWNSDGVNVCFDIEEEKEGINHVDKDYKHRFIIQDNCKIRQCSPTMKKEAYANYKGLVGLINEFLEQKDIDYTKYIIKEIPQCDKVKAAMKDIVKNKK